MLEAAADKFHFGYMVERMTSELTQAECQEVLGHRRLGRWKKGQNV